MLEYDSDDYLNRFDLVIPVLKSLKGSIVEPGVVKAPRKSRKRLAWIIIPLAVGIAGTAYSYFNPDQFATVSHSLQRLLTAAFNN